MRFDDGVLEVKAVVDVFAGLNRMLVGWEVERYSSGGMGEARTWNAVSIPTPTLRLTPGKGPNMFIPRKLRLPRALVVELVDTLS